MRNKIPVTEEEIAAYLRRKKRAHAPSFDELQRNETPVSKRGVPLKGKALIRYYEQRARQA